MQRTQECDAAAGDAAVCTGSNGKRTSVSTLPTALFPHISLLFWQKKSYVDTINSHLAGMFYPCASAGCQQQFPLSPGTWPKQMLMFKKCA